MEGRGGIFSRLVFAECALVPGCVSDRRGGYRCGVPRTSEPRLPPPLRRIETLLPTSVARHKKCFDRVPCGRLAERGREQSFPLGKAGFRPRDRIGRHVYHHRILSPDAGFGTRSDERCPCAIRELRPRRHRRFIDSGPRRHQKFVGSPNGGRKWNLQGTSEQGDAFDLGIILKPWRCIARGL